MSKKINIAEPTIIETDLTPLSDNFEIRASDTTEQWYRGNNGEYLPDREDTPLVLTPFLSVVDTDQGTSYTPQINTIKWSVTEYDVQTGWATREITSSDPEQDYYKPTGTNLLVVRKNVSYTYGVTVQCDLTYLDPRDNHVSYNNTASITLSTNYDATVIYPTLDIQEQKTTEFFVLTAQSSTFTFHASAKQEGADISASVIFQWYGVEGNSKNEVLIDTLPCYVSGQSTAVLTLDAMYTDNLTIILRAKPNAQADLYPDRVYRSLVWSIPKISAKAVCKNGGAVRENSSELMNFDVMLQLKGGDMPDAARQHLAFNWKVKKTRNNNPMTVTDKGWSPTLAITKSELINNDGYSTLVDADIYLLSPYERVTYLNENVTYSNEQVYGRSV